MLSNVRIDYNDGEDTASMKAYALYQHAPPGKGKQPDGPKFMTGVDYSVDVVSGKEDGLWKINTAVLDVIWTHGIIRLWAGRCLRNDFPVMVDGSEAISLVLVACSTEIKNLSSKQ